MPSPSTTSPGSSPACSVDEVLKEAEHILVSQLARSVALHPQATLASLGLDSVERLTLAVALEDRFQVCLPDEEAAQVTTLGELAELVLRRAGGGR